MRSVDGGARAHRASPPALVVLDKGKRMHPSIRHESMMRESAPADPELTAWGLDLRAQQAWRRGAAVLITAGPYAGVVGLDGQVLFPSHGWSTADQVRAKVRAGLTRWMYRNVCGVESMAGPVAPLPAPAARVLAR